MPRHQRPLRHGANKEPIQYTDCPVRNLRGCDWDHFAEGDYAERECTIVSTLHTLVRHPEDFQRLAKRDPSTAVVQYKELLRHWRRHI